ncbi:MAG: hypothetical protein MUP76_02310 [Acidimicrobiia bacterium]|nr:hypothetical protein [Acidimicrobiia bacterium]
MGDRATRPYLKPGCPPADAWQMTSLHAVTTFDAPGTVAPPYPPLAPVHQSAPLLPAESAEPLGVLPAEWARLDAVAVGDDVVDTLLVGPNGLFAVHVDPDLRPAAVRPGIGLLRAGTRQPEQVKRALRNTEALRMALAFLPGDLFPYPVLVTSTPGEAGHRLGRLLVVRPGRLPEVIWRHVSRPLRRSERAAILKTLTGRL